MNPGVLGCVFLAGNAQLESIYYSIICRCSGKGKGKTGLFCSLFFNIYIIICRFVFVLFSGILKYTVLYIIYFHFNIDGFISFEMMCFRCYSECSS